jgi:hypothetical protein
MYRSELYLSGSEESMWRVPVLAKERNPVGAAQARPGRFQALCRPLPTFYMSDYSALGLLVDRPEEAVLVLGAHKYPLTEDDCGAEVAIDHPKRLQEMIPLLSAQGLGCEIADVVTEVYHG